MEMTGWAPAPRCRECDGRLVTAAEQEIGYHDECFQALEDQSFIDAQSRDNPKLGKGG